MRAEGTLVEAAPSCPCAVHMDRSCDSCHAGPAYAGPDGTDRGGRGQWAHRRDCRAALAGWRRGIAVGLDAWVLPHHLKNRGSARDEGTDLFAEGQTCHERLAPQT